MKLPNKFVLIPPEKCVDYEYRCYDCTLKKNEVCRFYRTKNGYLVGRAILTEKLGGKKEKKEVINIVQIKVDQTTAINDTGEYTGEIVDVKLNEIPNKDYDYLDVVIDVNVSESEQVEQRVGYPANITPRSGLGRLLARFGLDFAELEKGGELDIDEVLLGEKCEFYIDSDEQGEVTYFNIKRDTVKPA